MVDWTRTFSPTVVNDFRMGVNYVSTHSGGTDNGLGNVADELGIPGVNTRGPGLLALNFTGGFVSNIGSANIGTQQLFPSTVIQFTDSLIISKRSHTFHTGFQFMRERINPFYAGNYGRTGNMYFDGRWTAGPGNSVHCREGLRISRSRLLPGTPGNCPTRCRFRNLGPAFICDFGLLFRRMAGFQFTDY